MARRVLPRLPCLGCSRPLLFRRVLEAAGRARVPAGARRRRRGSRPRGGDNAPRRGGSRAGGGCGTRSGATPPPPAPAGTVIASQDTNWPGIVAEVTELSRKGNTLTAKVRLRNGGPDKQQAEVQYEEVYLMDAANAKKYEVLRDEKGTYIAALRSGWQRPLVRRPRARRRRTCCG